MNFASPYTFVSPSTNDESSEIREDEIDDAFADLALSSEAPADQPVQQSAQAQLPSQVQQQRGGGFFGRLFGSSQTPAAPSRPPAAPFRKPKKASRRPPTSYTRHVDTNVVSIDFSMLGEESQLATGDPVLCDCCKACLSVVSQLYDKRGQPVVVQQSNSSTQPDSAPPELSIPEDMDEDDFIWPCEFCGHPNVVTLDKEEIPTTDRVDYIIEPAPTVSSHSVDEDSSFLVFVIDVSGSMCVTTEIEGKVELKGHRTAQEEFAGLISAADGDQFLPHQQRNVTYISRLQSVQAAIEAQITRLVETKPKQKVGLVAFANDVIIYGDGTTTAVTIAGDRLSDYDHIIQLGKACKLTKPVSESANALIEKVYSLEPSGATALGPAVAAAVAMATDQRGSKIVICTDGLANVGLGSIDVPIDSKVDVGEFYVSIGSFAAAHGVTIDVIGIEGDGCAMEHLGAMSEATNGEVNMVDPAHLMEDFANILSNPVLATEVSLKFVLHSAMYFRDNAVRVSSAVPERATAGGGGENTDDCTESSVHTRFIGSVNSNTEVTFEYGVRQQDVQRLLSGLTHLPFQIQINFTRLNGMKCMRVVSAKQKITQRLDEALSDLRTPVMQVHAVQQCAEMAARGEYETSRANMAAYNRLLKANLNSTGAVEGYQQWSAQMQAFDSALVNEMEAEEADGALFAVEATSAQESAKRSKARSDRRARNDALATALRRNKKATSSVFSAPSKK